MLAPHTGALTLSLPVLLALTKGAAAWGNLGHETVGYVAMEVRYKFY